MKTILVDLGNTALKWAVLGNEHEPHTVVHRGAPESLHDLYEVWQGEAPDAVLGCTVAAPKLAFSATKFFNACDIPWQWVHSLPTFRCAQWELRNNYLHPELLGADRWCAAIGAIDSAPAEAILIVQLGTATTVDAVLRESERHYVFLGGRIAPGPTMMQQSLVNGTAALTSDIGLWQSEPRLTKDAIVTGILDSQAGLVRLAFEELAQQVRDPASVRVVVAGGSARFAQERMRQVLPQMELRHNLVFLGLAALARARTGS